MNVPEALASDWRNWFCVTMLDSDWMLISVTQICGDTISHNPNLFSMQNQHQQVLSIFINKIEDSAKNSKSNNNTPEQYFPI